MSLSCKHGETTLYSFDFDAPGWAGLKASNASEKNLRMTCCDEHVTLKTSKLGTQFFAHKCRGECTSAAETAEHLFVKGSPCFQCNNWRYANPALARGWCW